MNLKDSTRHFEKFFQDPLLQELIDLNTKSTNFLEIINPRETQHTDLLAWALNPREGHGQGDLVLKDFLIAIHIAATASEPGDRILGKGLTKDFVRTWTPRRIATTNFGSAVFFREFNVGSKKRLPLDLMVVDPDNKFVIVVENKAGTKLTELQLKKYLTAVKDTALRGSAFSGYQLAFVALDRDFEDDLDDDDNRPTLTEAPDKRWVLMNYEWLKNAAHRTVRALARGDSRATLLNVYSGRMSGQDSGAETSAIAIALAGRHPQCIDYLLKCRVEVSAPSNWTEGSLDPGSIEGQLTRFVTQRQSVINHITSVVPIDVFDDSLSKGVNLLSGEDQDWESGRTNYYYNLDPDENIPHIGDRWPLSLRVEHVNRNDTKGDPLFSITCRWRPKFIGADPKNKANIAGKFAGIVEEIARSKGAEKGIVKKVATKLPMDDALKEATIFARKVLNLTVNDMLLVNSESKR